VVKQPVELVSCTLDGNHGCQFRIKPDSDEMIVKELYP
jgi:hypothetical protein